MEFDLESLKASIAEVNAEIVRYTEMFGKDSRIVSDFMQALENEIGVKNTYFSEKKGAMQFRNTTATRRKISRSGNAEEVAEWYGDEHSFNRYVDRLRKKYEEESGGEDATEEDLAEYQEDIETVQNAHDDGTMAKVISEQLQNGRTMQDIKNMGYHALAELVQGERANQQAKKKERAKRYNGQVNKPTIKSRGGDLKHEGVSVKRI